MQEYVFYRLPHHITPGYINSKGEQQIGSIGVTNDFRRRLRERKSLGFDITDAYVLETGFYDNLKSAQKREYELQLVWDCLDHVHQKINHEKNSLSNKGRIAWNKGKPSTKKGSTQSKSPCPHCGLEVAANTMSRWHGDNCPHKQ